MATFNLKTGDDVIVTAGANKGKTGKISQVFRALNKVAIEGVNVRSRHLKPRREGEVGQKVSFAMPINASNVSLVGADGKPMRHTKRTK